MVKTGFGSTLAAVFLILTLAVGELFGASSSNNYNLSANVINSGGGTASSSGYAIFSALGQTDQKGVTTSSFNSDRGGLMPVLGGNGALYPVIGFNPGKLNFLITLNGANPAPLPLAINNTGSSLLKWDVSSGSNWINLSPKSGSGIGQISVTVNATGMPVGTYNDTIFVTGIGAINSPTAIPVTLTISPGYVLTVVIGGTGGGSIHSSPGGISCLSGSCSAVFDANQEVKLIAAPDSNSLLANMAPACGPQSPCTVKMDLDKSIEAQFDFIKPVKISTTPQRFYSLIQDAYDNAESGTVIQARAFDFSGNLLLKRGIQVVLKGGFDSSYAGNTGYSTLKGSLTIGTGSLTLEKFVIQ